MIAAYYRARFWYYVAADWLYGLVGSDMFVSRCMAELDLNPQLRELLGAARKDLRRTAKARCK